MTDGRQMVSIAIEYITHLPDLIHPVKWQLQINKNRSIALLRIISCIRSYCKSIQLFNKGCAHVVI